MTPDQRSNLLFEQEPIHTACARNTPSYAFGIEAAVGETVKVAFGHHEHQQIIWHIMRQADQSAPPIDTGWVVSPKTNITVMGMAETWATFQLTQPGIWWIMADATKNSSTISKCPPALFVVKGAKPAMATVGSRVRRSGSLLQKIR